MLEVNERRHDEAGEIHIEGRIALMAGRRVDDRQHWTAGGHGEAAQTGGDFSARGQRDVVSAQRRGGWNRDGDRGAEQAVDGDSGDLDAAAEAGRGRALEPVSLAPDDND